MQGREKEAVIISLVRSNNTVRPVFAASSSLHFHLGFDTEGCRIPKRKEKNEWCVLELSQLSISVIFLFLLLVAMTRAKRHLVSFWCSIYSSILIEHFSVLLAIPRPSAMGVNISRNGWLGWTPMLTLSMQDWNKKA